jgi:ankyrin repeat protein
MISIAMTRQAIALLSLTIPLFGIGCGKSAPKTDSTNDRHCVELINQVILSGKDLNQWKDKSGSTILSDMCARGNVRSIQMLIDHGIDIKSKEPVWWAFKMCFACDRLDSAKVLIQNGLLIGQEDNYFDIMNTAIHLSELYRREFISLLVGAGITDLNRPSKDDSLPLQWAAYHNRLDAAEILLQYGANVNAHDGFLQDTALHSCARQGVPDIAKFLIQHGADVNAKNKDGETPLAIALGQTDTEHESVWGKRKVAKLLKKHGGTK